MLLSTRWISFVLGALFVPAISWCAEEKPAEKPAAEPAPPPAIGAIRQPALTSVFPMDAHPGRTVEFSIRGKFLDGASRFQCETPDLTGSVVYSTFTEAKIKVTVSPQAETGPRYFRLLSPRGASNLLIVRVTNWPEVQEVDADGDIERANRVTAPALISGHLTADMLGLMPFGEGADLYRFHALAGQRLAMNVFGARDYGQRPGTPEFDPGYLGDLSLTLLTAKGRQLIFNEGTFDWDPYLDYIFVKEGDYIAAVTPTRLPSYSAFSFPRFNTAYYQLALGNAPLLWGAFPLGARRGTDVELELRGDFLPDNPRLILHSAGLDGSVEKTPQTGLYKLKLHVSKDATLGIHRISVDEPSGVTAPLTFVVGDLPERVEIEPNDTRETADTLAFPIVIDGRMNHKNDQDWFKFEAKANQKLTFEIQGENFAGSVLDAVLTLTDSTGKELKRQDDGEGAIGLGAIRDPKIDWDFKEAGVYYVKVESLLRHFGPDQNYRLTVRESLPTFTISAPVDRHNAPRGEKSKITVYVSRKEGFDGEVQLEARNLPPGVTVAPAVIEAKKLMGTIELTVEPGAQLSTTPIDLIGKAVIGKASSGDALVEKTATLPGIIRGRGPGFWDYRPSRLLLSIIDAPQFSMEPLVDTVELVRGNSADFTVKLVRRENFTAPVKVSVRNLPAGVTLVSWESEKDGTQLRLKLRASDSAPKTIENDLTVVAEAQAGDRSLIESSPKISVQVE